MTFSLYLSKAIGAQIVLNWVVLLLLAIGIELLRSSSDLIERGGVAMLAEYAWLQVPLLGTVLFPISVLTGTVIAFLTLSMRSELTIIRAAGKSIKQALIALIPLAIVLGIFHHQLSGMFSAMAQRGLTALIPLEIPSGATPEKGDAVWSRAGGEVVRAYPAAADGRLLADVTIFQLDGLGHMTGRLTATLAKFTGEGWKLTDVSQTTNSEITHFVTLHWDTQTTPADILSLADGQREAGLDRAQAVLAGEALQTRGRSYYETRIARGYAAFAVPGIMLILASIAAFSSSRLGGSAQLSVLAITLGFLYVAVDGFSASLGEVGAIDPMLAAFAPSGAFLITGLWCLLLQED